MLANDDMPVEPRRSPASVSADFSRHLRIFYALGLLIIGVLYPEEKTKIAGIHWTPFAAFLGITLVLAFKEALDDGIARCVFMFIIVATALLVSTAFWLFAYNDLPILDFLLRHYLTLLVTTSICFLLVSDIPPSFLLKAIYRFMFCLSLGLILTRAILFDFSREGTFLGLGPLTFARYVCLGWIAQVLHDRRMKLLPSFVFALGLLVADSKGPILFLCITFFVYMFAVHRIKRLRSALLLIGLAALLGFSGRFSDFVFDLRSLLSDDLAVPNVVEFEASEEESVSSTVSRLVAITASLELIEQRPLAGWGAGMWPAVTGLHSLEYPHNSIIEIWVEYGFFGLAIFIFFVVMGARGIKRGNPFSFFVVFCGLLSLTTGSIKDLRVLVFFILLTLHFNFLFREKASATI